MDTKDNRGFEAIILAGGKGTRLKSVSGDTPKPMVEVAGVPFIYRVMKWLEQQGATKIVLALGYRPEIFIESLSHQSPVECEVAYSIEDRPLGTGGAIKKALELTNSDYVVVMNGDTYCEADLKEMLECSRLRQSELCIGGVRVADATRYGTLELDDQCNVVSMREKGVQGAGVINSGLYVVNRTVFENFAEECFSFESDVIPTIGERFRAVVSDGYFIDIGIPQDYYKACEYFS